MVGTKLKLVCDSPMEEKKKERKKKRRGYVYSVLEFTRSLAWCFDGGPHELLVR